MANQGQKPRKKHAVGVIWLVLIPSKREKRRENIRYYNFAYIFVELCCALAVLSLLLCYWPAWSLAAILERMLTPLFQPAVMAAVVSLVGVSGVVFAWLISHTEDRVCGVRMSVLIDWAYPYFFRLYFLLFIGLAVFATLVGNAQMFWPTFYAFLGVLASLVLLCRVCYLFVVRADFREGCAFDYYAACLEDEKYDDAMMRETLLNVADYTRLLLTQEHRDVTAKTIRLWLQAFPDDRDILSIERVVVCQEQEDTLVRRSDLFRSAWATLFPKGFREPQDDMLLRSMLRHMDQCVRDDGEDKNTYCRQAILLGLSQFFLEMENKKYDLDRICALLIDVREGEDAALELACAWLAMLCVVRIDDATKASLVLPKAVGSLFPLVEKSLAQRGKDDETLNGFLFHAHWIARRVRRMKPSIYLLKIDRYLRQANGGVVWDRIDLEDQKKLLLILLCDAILEDKRGGEQ